MMGQLRAVLQQISVVEDCKKDYRATTIAICNCCYSRNGRYSVNKISSISKNFNLTVRVFFMQKYPEKIRGCYYVGLF